MLAGRPGNNPFCHYRVLRLNERGWREVIVQREAPAEKVPFDHGRFEIMVEDADGHRHGQDIFARAEFQDLAPGEGASLDALVLCEACDHFFYEGEPECPHCRASATATRDADEGVRTAQRVMDHVSEIARILQRITESARQEDASAP